MERKPRPFCWLSIISLGFLGLVPVFLGFSGAQGADCIPRPPIVAEHPPLELLAKDSSGAGLLAKSQGKRILILAGTPEEMGRAHGNLLRDDIRRLTERVLYVVGGADSLVNGVWFMEVMGEIHRRTKPFIPERFFRECDALSDAAGLFRWEGRFANLFPERFHCSGVAVRGKASKEGRVLHARVLDYMTDVHLQDAAVLTVFIPEGLNAWMSVGYAGLIGSVSAMNEKGLAIGEMGGRGEGDWDGLPMTFLMRQIMETCDTVDEALDLMRQIPRTCEYFYVLSDRNGNLAAVHADVRQIIVLRPGEQHPLLPPVPEDTVFISADERAQHLSRRLHENFGEIDVPTMIEIIKRPVAMRSNLHNAIFAPETLELWFADATRTQPACDQSYAYVRLPVLLDYFRKEMNSLISKIHVRNRSGTILAAE
jgi:hypothetical protein